MSRSIHIIIRTFSLLLLLTNDAVHSRPALVDVELNRAIVRQIPNEIMARVLNRTPINDNSNVIVSGYLVTQNDNSNGNVITRVLDDDDVSVKTIFYDDRSIDVLTNPRVFDGIHAVRPAIIDSSDTVKTSYDVPLHSVEALPPVNLQEYQKTPLMIDVRFGGDDSQQQQLRNRNARQRSLY